MKTKILFAASIALALLFISCSKHNSKPAKKECRISHISWANGSTDVTYNGQNQISSIIINFPSIKYDYEYVYSDGKITETCIDSNGKFIFKAVFTLNGAGQITSAMEYDNTSGSKWRKIVYEYNGDQVVKATGTNSAGVSFNYTYTWKDGNMTSISTGDAFVYYTNKARIPGDAFALSTIFTDNEGISFWAVREVKNKNLLKSINNSQSDFSYTFDADGKISSVTKTDHGNTPVTYTYTYECK